MNTRSPILLAIVATLFASAVSAAPSATTAVGYPASEITVTVRDPFTYSLRTRTVTAGTTKATTVSLLGKPGQALSPELYLYDNCEPDQSVARVRGCNTLVVTFSNDVVTGLKFVNRAGAMVIAANARTSRPDSHNNGPTAGNNQAVAIPNR